MNHADEPRSEPLSAEELRAHEGEALPNREVMSSISPSIGTEPPIPTDDDIVYAIDPQPFKP